jgi:hypothetical protein
MTMAAYARRIGTTPPYIYQLKKSGVVTVDEDGLLDADEADAAIAKHRDPSKPMQRKGTPDPDAVVIRQGDFEKTGTLSPDTGDDDDEAPPAGGWQGLYIKSRAIKERELARSAKLRADAEEGRLVDAEEVALQWANVGVIIRQKLSGIPSRLSAQLAVITDEAEARRLLQAEINITLTALTQQLSEEFNDADEPA